MLHWNSCRKKNNLAFFVMGYSCDRSYLLLSTGTWFRFAKEHIFLVSQALLPSAPVLGGLKRPLEVDRSFLTMENSWNSLWKGGNPLGLNPLAVCLLLPTEQNTWALGPGSCYCSVRWAQRSGTVSYHSLGHHYPVHTHWCLIKNAFSSTKKRAFLQVSSVPLLYLTLAEYSKFEQNTLACSEKSDLMGPDECFLYLSLLAHEIQLTLGLSRW